MSSHEADSLNVMLNSRTRANFQPPLSAPSPCNEAALCGRASAGALLLASMLGIVMLIGSASAYELFYSDNFNDANFNVSRYAAWCTQYNEHRVLSTSQCGIFPDGLYETSNNLSGGATGSNVVSLWNINISYFNFNASGSGSLFNSTQAVMRFALKNISSPAGVACQMGISAWNQSSFWTGAYVPGYSSPTGLYSVDLDDWAAYDIIINYTGITLANPDGSGSYKTFHLTDTYQAGFIFGPNPAACEIDNWNMTVTVPSNATDIIAIRPTFSNNTITANSTALINVSTNSTFMDACIIEITNSSGSQNLTMNIVRGNGIGSLNDSCFLVIAQPEDWLQYRIYAGVFGVFNTSKLYNMAFDSEKPQMTNNRQDSQCYTQGSSVSFVWVQDDNMGITNSTCIWTNPAGASVSTNTLNASSCGTNLPFLGIWQWHIFLNDSAGNEQNYYAGINAQLPGTCGGGSGTGGGGGGAGDFIPVINISLTPIITPEQIEALPANQLWAAIILPRLGPFSIFHLAMFGYAAFYFRKKEQRKGINLLFAGAIFLFAFIVLWQAAGVNLEEVLPSIQGSIAQAASNAAASIIQARGTLP